MEAAAANIRALKAQNASQTAVRNAVEAYAAERVRTLKANNAPQEEVEAAVAAYEAHHAAPLVSAANVAEGEQKVEEKAVERSRAPVAQFESIEAAAEHVRRLKARKASQAEVKAAVDGYLALEEAVEKVKRLKANKASQGEVKAAVDEYLALTNVKASAPSSNSALEEAKNKVAQLKARMAPQAEVRAAVDQYVSLKYGRPLPPAEPERTVPDFKSIPEPTPTPTPAHVPTSVEEAADRIRALKASRASQEDVQAAVNAYNALRDTAGGEQKQAAPVLADLPDTVQGAAELVKSLKTRMAPQAEVRAAVDHYVSLNKAAAVSAAADKVRAVKEAKAPQAEVEAAVSAYMALTNPPAAAAPTTISSAASSLPVHDGKVDSVEEAAERVRALKAGRATQEAVQAAVADYVALRDARDAEPSDPIEAAAARVKDLKARHAPADEVKAAVAHYVSLKGLPGPAGPKEAPVKSAEVDAAEQHVQALKAKLAPQTEVRAAVEAYLALKYPSRAKALESKAEEAVRPEVSESPAPEQSALDVAVAKVRELKAAKAPQEQVTAAVEELKALRAASEAGTTPSPLDAAVAKVRALKEARAPQEEVTAAVEALRALKAAPDAVLSKAVEGEGKVTEAVTAPEPVAQEAPVADVSALPPAEAEAELNAVKQAEAADDAEPAVRLHLPAATTD